MTSECYVFGSYRPAIDTHTELTHFRLCGQ
jgi:hypothetical protein